MPSLEEGAPASCAGLTSVPCNSAVAEASLRVMEPRISLGISYAVEQIHERSSHNLTTDTRIPTINGSLEELLCLRIHNG